MIDLDQCFQDRMNHHQPPSVTNHADHQAQLVAEDHAVLGSFHPRHHHYSSSVQNHHHHHSAHRNHHHHHHRHHSSSNNVINTSPLKSIDGSAGTMRPSNGDHYDGACLLTSSPIPMTAATTTPEKSRSGLLQSQLMEKKVNHNHQHSGCVAAGGNLPLKDSRINKTAAGSDNSVVAISSLLKISNKTDPAAAGLSHTKSVSSPTGSVTMTVADSLRRKKKSHLSRDELARVCQLNEVTFEPYNNSSYMIAIRSKGDRKSLIGYRCDWNNCGYMNARVERMFGHIRSQHPEAPTVKKLVTTASNGSSSTTTATTSTSLICSSTLTTPSATRHRSSSSLSTASLSSSSSSAASSSQSPHSSKSNNNSNKPATACHGAPGAVTPFVRAPCDSPVNTGHNNNALYKIDHHSTFGNVKIKVEPDDTVVGSPPSHGNLKRDTKLKSDNKRNHQTTKSDSYLFELLNSNDHGDHQDDKSTIEISSDENVHCAAVINPALLVDQPPPSSSIGTQSLLPPKPGDSSDELIEKLRTIGHHYETNETAVETAATSSVPSTSDLNTVDRNNNNHDPVVVVVPAAIMMNEARPDTENIASEPTNDPPITADASTVATLVEPEPADPVPPTAEIEKEKFALSQDDFDSLFVDINKPNASPRPAGQFDEENVQPTLMSAVDSSSLVDPSGSVTPMPNTIPMFVPEPELTPVHEDYGDYSQYGDYPYNANGNDFGIENKSDNSQPTSNTNDSLLYENETSFDIDASLNDGSNSSHGGLDASKKRKTGNSKNYIGKQNLFQEFQSDDVAKIRDTENKYIIALQKDMKIVGYRCDWPECEFLTCRKYVMVNHINGKHTNQRPYSCDMCNFTFVKRYFLKAHMYKVHKRRMSIDRKDDDEESLGMMKRDPSDLNDSFDEGHSFEEEYFGGKKFKSDHPSTMPGRFYPGGEKIDDIVPIDDYSYGSCPPNGLFDEKHRNPSGSDVACGKFPKSNYGDYANPSQIPMDRFHQHDQFNNGLMGANNHQQLYYKGNGNGVSASMIYPLANNGVSSNGMAMNSNRCYNTSQQPFETEPSGVNNGSFETYCSDGYRSSSSSSSAAIQQAPGCQAAYHNPMYSSSEKSSGQLPAMDLLLTPPLSASTTCCSNPLSLPESYEFADSSHQHHDVHQHHHHQQRPPQPPPPPPPPHPYPLSHGGQSFEEFLSPPSSISSSGSSYSGCHTSSLPSDPMQPVRVTTTTVTNSNTAPNRPTMVNNNNSNSTPTMLANSSSFYLHTPSPSPSSLTHSPASAGNTGPPMFPTETASNYTSISKMAGQSQSSHYQTNFTDSFAMHTDANNYPVTAKPPFHNSSYDYGFNSPNPAGTQPPPPPPPPQSSSSLYNSKNYCDSGTDFNLVGQQPQPPANSQEQMIYVGGQQMVIEGQPRNESGANFMPPDCWMSPSPW